MCSYVNSFVDIEGIWDMSMKAGKNYFRANLLQLAGKKSTHVCFSAYINIIIGLIYQIH